MLEIHHHFDRITDEKIYEAIYLDDMLLIAWAPTSIIELNEAHPSVREAIHVNKFSERTIK